jgi:hypothetical protein
LATQLASTGLSIAWVNTAFTPAAGTLYVTESFAPAGEIPIRLSGTVPFAALYTVIVYAPLNQTRAPAINAAELVRTAFTRGTRLVRFGSTVTVRECIPSAGFVSGDRYALPITIRVLVTES